MSYLRFADDLGRAFQALAWYAVSVWASLCLLYECHQNAATGACAGAAE